MTTDYRLLLSGFCLFSFIIGSIPTGLLLSRTKGIDLRKVGSGNIGATNVLRVMGREAALLTLLGDMLKGALPLIIFRGFGDWFPLSQPSTFNLQPLFEGMLGVFAILGHNFSLFLKFKGGKGVATSFGVLFAYSPYVGLLTAIFWLLAAKWTRYSSLSALIAFGLLPISFYLLDPSNQKLVIATAISLLIFIRHTGNIKRLVQGTESRIGQKG